MAEASDSKDNVRRVITALRPRVEEEDPEDLLRCVVREVVALGHWVEGECLEMATLTLEVLAELGDARLSGLRLVKGVVMDDSLQTVVYHTWVTLQVAGMSNVVNLDPGILVDHEEWDLGVDKERAAFLSVRGFAPFRGINFLEQAVF